MADARFDGRSPLACTDLRLDRGRFSMDGVDVALERGAVTAIIGPNGSGKTTLLRLLGRLLRPDAGAVYLDGRAIATMPTREIARRLAILPQGAIPPDGVTVEELVQYGRHPHRRLLQTLHDEDREAVGWALDVTGLEAFADRPLQSLSGGERQRAWIAMALAQKTGVLLLDEPTTYLDIRYQVEVLSLVRSLNRQHGLTVGWVLHDLNQAATYSDQMILLDRGQVAARGTPTETLTADTLERVFGVPIAVSRHPTAGTPFVIPLDPSEAHTPRAERMAIPLERGSA